MSGLMRECISVVLLWLRTPARTFDARSIFIPGEESRSFWRRKERTGRRSDGGTGRRGENKMLCARRACSPLHSFSPSPLLPFSLSASSRLRFASSLSHALDDEERDVVNGGRVLRGSG